MEIRDYIAGDEIHILKLFEIVFGKPMQLSYWKWRFNDNPAGKHLIKLMWEKDQLIGHYAVSPVNLGICESNCLSALSMTTMTHPEFGGLGIFGFLANSLYERLEMQLDAKAIYGFPNNNSHYGFVRNLKWENLGQISHMILSAGKIKPTLSDQVQHFTSFTDEHAALMLSVTSQFKVSVNRNTSYLNWRYVNNTTSSYDKFEFRNNNELLGLLVVKQYPSSTMPGVNDLFITEVGITKKNASLLKVFLSHISAFYGPSKAKINTWISLFDNRYIHFEKAGFEPGGKPTYFCVRPNAEMKNELTDFRNWYLSYGDSDIY